MVTFRWETDWQLLGGSHNASVLLNVYIIFSFGWGFCLKWFYQEFKKKKKNNEKRPTSLSCLHGKEWVSWARAWLRTDTRSGTRVAAKPRCARRAWPRGAPSGPAPFAPPRSGLPSSDADHTDVSSLRFLLLLFFNGNVKQRHFPLYLFSMYWYLHKQTITLSSLRRTVAVLAKKLVYVACSHMYSVWRVHGSMFCTYCWFRCISCYDLFS